MHRFHLNLIMQITARVLALIFYVSLFSSLLFSITSNAQTQQSGLMNEFVPVQEFVISSPVVEEDRNVNDLAQAKTLPSEQNPIPLPVPSPITDEEGYPIFPTKPPDVPAQPSSFPDASEMTSTLELTDTTRAPKPLSTLQFFEVGDPSTAAVTAEFAGGVDESNFIKCAKMSVGVCSRASNDADYQKCTNRMKQQPACEQFFAFAAMSSFNRNDEVDLVQYYKEGQLTLVHVIRVGENYPGDYYTIGTNGDFSNITAGAAIKNISITKDLHYPEITSRYPKAQIWSIVEQLPLATASLDGGLRLIFRFVLLNGCLTCDKAGYANVAYDFSGTGALRRVSLLSLDPIS